MLAANPSWVRIMTAGQEGYSRTRELHLQLSALDAILGAHQAAWPVMAVQRWLLRLLAEAWNLEVKHLPCAVISKATPCRSFWEYRLG